MKNPPCFVFSFSVIYFLLLKLRHDTWHDDTNHNDAQRDVVISYTQYHLLTVKLSVIMLNALIPRGIMLDVVVQIMIRLNVNLPHVILLSIIL